MKRIFAAGLISPAVLFLVFGTAAVVYAQKEQEKEARPAKPHQEQKQQARPAQQQPQRAQHEQTQQARPAQQQPQRAQHEQTQQARPAHQQPQRAQHEQTQQARPAQQQPQRAQHEQTQQARPAQQRRAQHEPQQNRPARDQQAQSTQHREGHSVPQRSQQEAQGWQQQRGWLHQGGGWQGNKSWQQGRASAWQSQHRTWGERGGYGGYYIPDDRFAMNFGSDHWFRIDIRPAIVGGYPRFQHDGFWFMLVDPWPESWSEDWYATDDVYVGYDNGYYLYNRRDPGDAIAISIVL